MKKKILALVLARKGSIRLKNKNILKLNGKHLVEWTFEQLSKKSIKKKFVDVLVSTDSKKILNLSRKYKLLSPWLRPKGLSNKTSSSAESAMHALNWYESNIEKVDGLFLFQPTSPFRNDKKIISAIQIFFKTNKQVVSVCSKQLHKFNKNSVNGSMYLTPTNILKKYHTFSKHGFVPLKMFSELENLDINTREDFERAKKLLKK